jgi:PncC family amidohydrolase
MESDLISQLKRGKADLVTAESCTGGLIAHRITNVAGSSDVFWGGWIVYHNGAKLELGVPEALLNAHGAVSSEVAQALAQCALKKSAGMSDRAKHYSLATTGIAGPTGGSPSKPVGLCFIAAASSAGQSLWKKIQSPYPDKREENKNFFADQALILLQDLIHAE